MNWPTDEEYQSLISHGLPMINHPYIPCFSVHRFYTLVSCLLLIRCLKEEHAFHCQILFDCDSIGTVIPHISLYEKPVFPSLGKSNHDLNISQAFMYTCSKNCSTLYVNVFKKNSFIKSMTIVSALLYHCWTLHV